MWAAVWLVAFSLLFKLLLVQPLAHGGLALGQTLATVVSAGYLLWQLRKRLTYIGGRQILLSLAVNLLTALAGGLAGLGTFRLIAGVAPGDGLIAQALRLFPALGMVVVVHVALALVLGNREGAEVVSRAWSRLARRRA